MSFGMCGGGFEVKEFIEYIKKQLVDKPKEVFASEIVGGNYDLGIRLGMSYHNSPNIILDLQRRKNLKT
jgi:hypothetical protein